MNKVAIIAGFCGLIVGATGGYFGCHFIEKNKNDKKISDEVQRVLGEIKDNQRQKIMENEEKKDRLIKTTGREVYAVPHFTATDLVKDIIEDNGYKKDEKQEEVKEPDEAPDDDSDLPFEIGEVESHNIWDDKDEEDDSSVTQEEYDATVEPEESIDIQKLDITKPPYPITKEQYDEELMTETEDGRWDKVDLIFFKDNVFAERAAYNEYTTMSSLETELAIGKDNMKRFIEDKSLGMIFIRNNKLHIDYNIVRSPRSYSSAIHDEEEE